MPPADNPSEILKEAVENHQANRLDTAMALYRDVLAREPRNPDALHLLGVIHLQRGALIDAIQLIEAAIAADPSSAAFSSNLCDAYRLAGNLERASVHGERAVSLGPLEPTAHNNLGMVLQGQGRLDEALERFERAIELNPFLPLPYGNAANILFAQSRFYEAAALLREGLRLMPGNPSLIAGWDQVIQAIQVAESATL